MLPDVARRLSRRSRRPATEGAAEPEVRTLDDEYRQRLRTSPVFHQGWVEAQLGASYPSVDAAIDAYLAAPGCTPHPLFLPEFIDRSQGRPKPGRDPLMWYAKRPRVQRVASPHPLIDVAALLAAHPELDDHPLGPVLGWIDTAAPDTPVPVPAGLAPTTYGELLDRSLAAARDWRADVAVRTAPRVVADPPAGLLEGADAAPLPSYDGPLVSIVMPMWNRAHTVRAAIASVQAQGFRDWELLVVDDGSTDDSLQVVEGIAHFDPRVVPVAAAHGGVCRARNEGIARARGRWLAFLDTDNTWRPDFLAVMLGELERHDWDMAHAALQAATAGETYYRAYEGTHADLLAANHVDLNVLLARTDLVREVGCFDETLRRGVDYDLVLKLAERTSLHLVPYLGVDYVDVEDDAPRISTTERPEWLAVVSSRHQMRAQAVPGPRADGVTSLVLPVPSGLRPVQRWALAVGPRPDVELVLVGTRLPLLKHVAAELLAVAAGGRFVRLQVDRGPETAANVGLAAARGARCLVTLEPVELDLTVVDRLTAALDDPAVGLAVPVVVGHRELVSAAGATFGPDSLHPVPFLRDHPLTDLAGLGDGVDLPAALGPVLIGRTDQLVELDGLDPLFSGGYAETDLSLRLHRAYGGATRLLPQVRVVVDDRPTAPEPAETERARLAAVAGSSRLLRSRGGAVPPGSAAAWRQAGFDVERHDFVRVEPGPVRPDDDPVLEPRPRLAVRRAEVREGVPSLRWTIDLASPSGPGGRKWGDTYYGEQLAEALRARGQQVAVDGRDARHRQTRDLDDVVLVLRGLDRVRPRPGRVNLQWIISHPDQVTPEEAAPYDVVFAASMTWAAEQSAAWGLPVLPLLQATDPRLFHADRAPFDSGEDLLFVGNSRRIYRSSLRHARAAGLDVTVHGSLWKEILGEDAVASEFVDNADLGAMYAAAGVVLNDHWEDMRVGGFVSNRLMDAAASGARVASDPVPGVDLSALFHGLVQAYDGPEELRLLVAERTTRFPDGEARRAAAAAVAAEHSFDVRAQTLLDAAVERWRARGA